MGKKKSKTEELSPEEQLIKRENFVKCQKLVEFFLKMPKTCNWANEIKNAKDLITINNDLEFWWGIDLKNKLNSLVFFKTPEGKQHIDLQKKKVDFSFAPPVKFELSPTKIGENKVISKQETILQKLSNNG